MGGHAFKHKLVNNTYLFPPKNLIIIGRDTPHVQGQHPLWRGDVNDPPPETFVASIRKQGFIQPVRARKLAKDLAAELGVDPDEYAEVVVGRERVKSARIIEDEGTKIVVPTMLFPANVSIADIIGAANAENYQRKTESVLMQAEHVFEEMKANGYMSGMDELECAKVVSVSTGMSVQRIRNLLAFRADPKLVAAHGEVQGEALLAIATLAQDKRAAMLEKARKDKLTVADVREHVSFAKNASKPSKPAKEVTPDASGNAKLHVVKDEPTKSKSPPKPAPKPKEDDGRSPGLSKPTMRRIVEHQMALKPTERVLDEAVLKAFKVGAGLAKPGTIGGLVDVLRDLGFEV